MKKFSLLFVVVVVAMLVLVNVAFAQPIHTEEQAYEFLSNPDKLKKTYKTDYEWYNSGIKPERVARKLLNLVKDDQQFLRQVYTLYADGKVEGFVACNAIKLMTPGDEDYFKQVFVSGKGYHIKTEAFRKINDLAYVKQMIIREARVDEGAANPASDFLLVRGDELYKADPQFVDALAENATDVFVRSAAIGATSNKNILQKYASLGEKEADQYFHGPNSVAAHRAFNNSRYKATAVWRLAQLAK